jgi:hypothetical protein
MDEVDYFKIINLKNAEKRRLQQIDLARRLIVGLEEVIKHLENKEIDIDAYKLYISSNLDRMIEEVTFLFKSVLRNEQYVMAKKIVNITYKKED